ncbi:MAG TPA: hypothetical protein VIV34_01065 [Pseudolabrys sp.]|jgi:hypothetical protein
MTDLPHGRRSVLEPNALDGWALAIATALVALIVLGVLPHLSW